MTPITALWTTLPGFGSLPPSLTPPLRSVVWLVRQCVLRSCRGAPAASRAKVESPQLAMSGAGRVPQFPPNSPLFLGIPPRRRSIDTGPAWKRLPPSAT